MCVCVCARAADKASFYDYVFFLHCIRLHLEAALVLFLLLFRRRNIFSMTTVEAVIASRFYTGPRIYRHIFMLPLCARVCVCECLAADSPGGGPPNVMKLDIKPGGEGEMKLKRLVSSLG